MTIFGFNTDIRCGDTVYHVQTEARQSDASLVSAVFVRGRCIGKHSTPVGLGDSGAQLGEQEIHEKLRAQHRMVVQIVRDGGIEDFLRSAPAQEPSVLPEQDRTCNTDPLTSPEEKLESPGCLAPLALEWVRPEPSCRCNQVSMWFRVSAGEEAVPGAQLIARLDVTGRPALYYRQTANDDGEAEVLFSLEMPVAEMPVSVIVQATHLQQTITRKFQLQRV